MKIKTFRTSVARVNALVVGIDPGKNTGVCFLNGGDAQFFTTDFWGCIDFIDEVKRDHPDATFVVENGGLNNTTYAARGIERMTQRAAAKIGRNTGAANDQASLIIEYLNRSGIRCVVRKPDSKKPSHSVLEGILNCKIQSSNQHERDAIFLALSHMN
jgi:hypothetical protein